MENRIEASDWPIGDGRSRRSVDGKENGRRKIDAGESGGVYRVFFSFCYRVFRSHARRNDDRFPGTAIVVPSFTGFSWVFVVLPSFTGFTWVLLGFT